MGGLSPELSPSSAHHIWFMGISTSVFTNSQTFRLRLRSVRILSASGSGEHLLSVLVDKATPGYPQAGTGSAVPPYGAARIDHTGVRNAVRRGGGGTRGGGHGAAAQRPGPQGGDGARGSRADGSTGLARRTESVSLRTRRPGLPSSPADATSKPARAHVPHTSASTFSTASAVTAKAYPHTP
jgi:hypothetical protein